ncbi:unnamed protein product [marine sediment metagenome]|uniref:Uncharacterized protein n=1 Tax=marine sediment metagenome TaxID=412755 RepID=X1RXJ7_9ZZZZ
MALLGPKPTRASESELEQRMRERDRELNVNPPKVVASDGRFEITGSGSPRATPRVILGTPLASVRLASTPESKSVHISVKTPYMRHFSNGGFIDWWKEKTFGVPRWTLGLGLGGLGLIGLSLR